MVGILLLGKNIAMVIKDQFTLFSPYVVADSFKHSINARNADLVRWHLEHGADPNVRTRKGYTRAQLRRPPILPPSCDTASSAEADVTNTIATHNAAAMSIKSLLVDPGRRQIITYLLDFSASINQLKLTADENIYIY